MKHLFTSTFMKQLVAFVIGLFEGFLALRVFLKLIAANPDTPFVRWVYDTTYPLVYPFLGMFPSSIKGLQVEIEFSTIFAMMIYALLVYVILYFISMLEKPSR